MTSPLTVSWRNSVRILHFINRIDNRKVEPTFFFICSEFCHTLE